MKKKTNLKKYILSAKHIKEGVNAFKNFKVISRQDINYFKSMPCYNCNLHGLAESYKSLPWTSTWYCDNCNCVNLIFHADRMGTQALNPDVVIIYSE